MPCPICGMVYCDHTPAQRGQTQDEIMADAYNMTLEEYQKFTGSTSKKQIQEESNSQ